MKIWIYSNGVQQGPFDIDQLPLERMSPSTPVWYQGLEYWMPAGRAPVTSRLFYGASPLMGNQAPAPQDDTIVTTESDGDKVVECDTPAPDAPAQEPSQEPSQEPARRQYHNPYNGPVRQAEQPACPPSYIVWSILLTVLCCNPIGIAPLLTGLSVRSKYRNYDYEGARKASELTQWLLMITIVISLMLAPLTIMMNML